MFVGESTLWAEASSYKCNKRLYRYIRLQDFQRGLPELSLYIKHGVFYNALYVDDLPLVGKGSEGSEKVLKNYVKSLTWIEIPI